MREVLGGRVELNDVDDLDALLVTAEAARRPAPPALAWSWDQAAAATWRVYDEAAAAPARWLSARRGRSALAVAKRRE
ncbi:MAG: hypothetical protein DLM64_09130 [Solirubrobacterales bacterium]|nr:MAG: hypothetical protein DLM64_09130 [Solirubrobacterales bacterium]